MPLPAPPRLPVPTGVGWLLLESLQQGAWLKKIAQIAAIGAKLLCKDEERAQAAFYKMLSKLRGGKQPRESTLTTFKKALRKGVLDLFQKSPAYMPELADCIAQRLDAATGPFAALAVGYVPLSPNSAQQRLFDFSNDLDQLGASFSAAEEKGDLAGAKDLFLRPNWLDEAYWSFPDPGMEDPRHNREALQAAENWEELRRAAAPLMLNTTLAWLSWLDLAVLTGDRDQTLHSPLFLPLATRFTPEAAAARQEGTPPPTDRWSDCFELPVPNLIRMLKNIASDTEWNIQKRAKPPETRHADKGEREKLSTALKEIGRHDLLSFTQFNNLLRALEPTPGADLQANEGCGFDVYALQLAANLFSLLTPREGKPPTNEKSPRTAPEDYHL